ncbi:MAG: cytochrome b5-like heme/steroid binding domain-containing protein [Candidatus Absconditicoccaceae bacterium]
MIYTISKKLLVISFLAFAIIAATFTFAKNDNKENDDGKNYLNGIYSQDDDEDDDEEEDDDDSDKRNKSKKYLSGDFGSGVIITSEQILCVKDAVEVRETSIITANTTFQTALLSGFNTRKTALSNARSLTTKEEIKVAVKNARRNFKSSKRLSEVTLKRSEKAAGETFKKAIKTCNMDSIINNMEKEGENVFKETKKQIQSPSNNNTPKTPKPVVTPTPTPTSPSYTLQDVKNHNTKSDCRTAINSKVYNLTSAFGKHPGGDTLLASLCGIEGTAKFNGQHGASSSAKAMLAPLKIGILK